MEMKKWIKKVVVIAIIAVIIVPGVIGSFALEDDSADRKDYVIDTNRKGSLTVHKYDYTAIEEDGVDTASFKHDWQVDSKAERDLSRYAIQGVEFSYIKVADIVQNSKGPHPVKVEYNLDSNLAQIMGLNPKKYYDSSELNQALDEVFRGEIKKTIKAKNKFEKYIKDSPKSKMPLTDSQGKTKIEGMDLGLYLIIETKVPANIHSTVNPFLVSIPTTIKNGENWFYDIYAYPKNESDIPTLDKKVRQRDDRDINGNHEYKDTATVSTGDDAEYLILSKLPKITSTATHIVQYTFKDIAEIGLKYNKDVEINFYEAKNDAFSNNRENSVLKLRTDDFKQTYLDNSMEISMTKEGLTKINDKMSEMYMVVSYSMKVTSTPDIILGDKGNTNNVRLEWRRSSFGYYDKLHARARVFAYGIDLTKEFKKSSNSNSNFDYTKVKFTIKNITDGHYLTNKVKADGIHYVTDNKKAITQNQAGIFQVNKEGKLYVRGLEADDYEITEIQTSDKYQLLKKPIKLSIEETKDEFTSTVTTHYDLEDQRLNEKNIALEGNPNSHAIEISKDRSTATVNGKSVKMIDDDNFKSNNAFVPMTVVNTPNLIPPLTGDKGGFMFIYLGIFLLFVAVIIIKIKHIFQRNN